VTVLRGTFDWRVECIQPAQREPNVSDLMAVLAGPASVRLGIEVSELLQAAVQAAIGALRRNRSLGAHRRRRYTRLAGRHRVRGLRRLPLSHLVGNTVALGNTGDLPPIEVTSVAPLLAAAIRRDHYDESLADLRVQR
jgi:hypothetical protein